MIGLTLSSSLALCIETPTVSLLEAQPVIDGMVLVGWKSEVVQDDGARIRRLRYTAPAPDQGAFVLEAHHPGSEGHIRLRYWLEEFPEENNFDSFGWKFGRVENLRAYLRQGYNSWDGSFYVQPEMVTTSGETESHLEAGYAMTQLLPRSGSGCVVVGFDRHDRFQQTFTFDMRGGRTALTVLTYWDQKDRKGLARCASEDLVIFDHDDVEAALRQWAHLVAAASPFPARVASSPINGWCSWYNLYSWHKRSEEYYILDTTHPDAFEYLREVFRTWRWEWRCEYFKTDFMYFGSEYGPDRARWHTPGLTRIEIWRRTAEMIRAEIGQDALWLGCGCPLWASVGLVEAARIGRDLGVEWQGDRSAQSLLRDLSARNFANHILWQVDPDCILLRHRYQHLTDSEVRSLALFAGMSGGVMMTSDALDQLSEDRLRLWRLLLNAERNRCNFPFLGQVEIDFQGTPLCLWYKRFRHRQSPHSVWQSR